MPIWPFRRRRRGTPVTNDSHLAQTSLLSETARSAPSPQPSATTSAPPPVAHTPRKRSRSLRQHGERKRPASQADQPALKQPFQPSKRRSHADSINKENVPPSSHGQYRSREDVTALPAQFKLEQSPHLRPVDLARSQIPYNFRPRSMSQTVSVQRQEGTTKADGPRTLQSKRSTTDHGSPARILSRTSSKTSRKRDDQLREEEIRAMAQPIPIPKRRGDDPLRRDSKTVRGVGGRDSQVTLPPEGSVHSTMSGVVEQRGWEIGGFAVFKPRPAVRLSGTPQYVPNSTPNSASGYLYRIDSLPKDKDKDKGKEKEKEKTPASRDRDRKRRTVGNEADDLDASDIRLIMERDAKRRELKQKERQEKLERKLRNREGRNRGDSDARTARRGEERRTSEARSRVEEEIQAHGPRAPPTAVHPALRNTAADEQPEPTSVGLGISKQPPPVATMESERQQQHTLPTTEDLGTANTGVYRDYRPADDVPQDSFSDEAKDATLPFATPMSEVPPPVLGASIPSSPMEDLMAEEPDEQPILATAQAVRMSQANTPPLSPIYGTRGSGSASQLTEALRQQSASALITSVQSSDLPAPSPINIGRRSSEPRTEAAKKTGWGSLFKRSTFSRRNKPEKALAPVATGFQNTSRESMRNQSIPAHLIDPNARRPSTRPSASGTSVRTQSKFREDLPDTPTSLPGSRTQSPDAPTVAGAMAAARQAGRNAPHPVDIPGRSDRNDTPLSQNVRGHAAMSGSLASIDSEGSWLASGSLKRQSNQSMLSRNLSQRRAEFSASYEELGGDKDAEYLSRNRAAHKVSSPALMGAGPDEESEDDVPPEIAGEPLTVHGSVRRKPTLVQRDPRLKSREGLVTEFASAEQVESAAESITATPDEDDYEPDSPGPQMERARSINIGSRHSRQFSAGSAKLLDVRRTSMDLMRKTPTPEPKPTSPSQ